jgi:hypothetical protein
MRATVSALFVLAAVSCGGSPDQARLEKEFQDMLSGATLVGRFTSSSSDRVHEDRYTVNSVTKLGGGLWTVNARIQYGQNDYTVPVPVRVVWAGDTPMITMTDVGLPGKGSFTARVLFYRGQYAGTWSNEKGVGGQMFGKLEKRP